MTYYKVEEMILEAMEGRAGFTTFARIFTGSFCVFGFLFVWVLFGCFSASQPVKRLLQVIPVSPFLLSHTQYFES